QHQRETLGGVEDVPLHWHGTIDEVPVGPCIILANEFFDALPVRQAERHSTGWHERAVAVDADGALVLIAAPDTLSDFPPTPPPVVARAPVGAIFEWRPDDFASRIARRVAAGGAALIIDYGHAKSATGDTFQGVRSHRYASPLAFPGLTDLTAHVDFEALGKAAHAAGAGLYRPTEKGTALEHLALRTAPRGARVQRGS